jgi:hypothetical protein
MKSDPRDYKLELSSASSPGGVPTCAGRPYLSVHFACCGVYQRIYRAADGAAYRGRCPRCGVPVNFPVGPGGTSARSFRVS